MHLLLYLGHLLREVVDHIVQGYIPPDPIAAMLALCAILARVLGRRLPRFMIRISARRNRIADGHDGSGRQLSVTVEVSVKQQRH